MIKTFTQHMQENAKIYEFQIRLALEATPEVMKRIEVALDAYGLDTISKPKSLPIQEDHINFPQLGAVELTIIECGLQYPVIPEAVQQLLIERAGVPESHVSVYTKAQEEFKTPSSIEFEEGQPALLDTAYETMPEGEAEKVYGNEFVSEFLDTIESRDMDIAGDNTEAAKTTNDLAQGSVSPVGSNQNKLPTAADLS